MDDFVSLMLELIWISFISSTSAGEVPLEKHPSNITAEPGQNVTLPCRTPDSKPVVGVEWDRTDLGSEYVLLYRNNQFDLEKQHPSFKNRVDLKEGQIKDGDVSLVLKNVSTDDRGTYECLVVQTEINRRRQTVLYINLDVVPPPDQRNITAELGQNVTLPCRALDIKPVIVVEWDRTDLGVEYVILFRNNQFDLENQHPSFKNRVDLQEGQIKDGDVSLTVKNVVTDDRGTYECRVSQSETSSRRQTVIYIKLDVVPPPGEPDDGKEGGPDGLWVGVVVPAIIIIAIVAVVVYIHKKRKKKSNPNQPPGAAAGNQLGLMLQDSSDDL
ncbi:tyrosine-protein kinase-like otk isoform X1 [Fundulus heteroclitus]|uniref:tyrosine-protein kinase-like otk isoform X1 n=1 Tax=Fundulus heteroclitus TaxID=8078 RepID=UPI00165C1556|nr:tyrosine-protein kinase-like otk isoform X1 [Fundulus heteroclitus]